MAGAQREAAYKRQRNLWKDILFDTRGSEGESVAQARLRMVESWRRDPWAYLTARDVPTAEEREAGALVGRPIIYTVDERDDLAPVKPFPAEKLYLREITYELWNRKERIFLVDKVRQMIITTLCALLIDWYCSFTMEREVFVSRVKEESAIKLINDKIRVVHARKPEWVQLLVPISPQPKNIITYLDTGSTVTGVAQNFASADARGSTGSLIFVDEAAYQEFFGQILRAVLPMTSRLWAVSTANIGNDGAAKFRDLIFDTRPSMEELNAARLERANISIPSSR